MFKLSEKLGYSSLLDSSPSETSSRYSFPPTRRSHARFFLACILPWIIAASFAMAHLYQSIYKERGHQLQAPLYSPAQEVLGLKAQIFSSGFDGGLSAYQGPPSPELDEEWDALYDFNPTRISKQQAALLPNATSQIPGDDGFVITLEVFHQLHCLNMIRKALSPDYYPPMTHGHPGGGEDHLLGFKHTDHCIDTIRQSIMCSADISPYVWRPDATGKLRPDNRVAHTCRNFERIWEWAWDNRIRGNLDDMDFVNGGEIAVGPS